MVLHGGSSLHYVAMNCSLVVLSTVPNTLVHLTRLFGVLPLESRVHTVLVLSREVGPDGEVVLDGPRYIVEQTDRFTFLESLVCKPSES